MTLAVRCNRFVLPVAAVTLASACTVQLVAPFNPDLLRKASAMQAEVVTWDLKMRAGAGTIADDPANPDVSATIYQWRGEAEAMLTLAVSNDPGTTGCSETVKTLLGTMQTAIPADLRPAAQSAANGGGAKTGCEAGLVEELQTGITAIEKALQHCRLSGTAAAASAAKPANDKTQQQIQASCLSEFKVDANVPAAAASASTAERFPGC